jgi:hypothetical protein
MVSVVAESAVTAPPAIADPVAMEVDEAPELELSSPTTRFTMRELAEDIPAKLPAGVLSGERFVLTDKVSADETDTWTSYTLVFARINLLVKARKLVGFPSLQRLLPLFTANLKPVTFASKTEAGTHRSGDGHKARPHAGLVTDRSTRPEMPLCSIRVAEGNNGIPVVGH